MNVKNINKKTNNINWNQIYLQTAVCVQPKVQFSTSVPKWRQHKYISLTLLRKIEKSIDIAHQPNSHQRSSQHRSFPTTTKLTLLSGSWTVPYWPIPPQAHSTGVISCVRRNTHYTKVKMVPIIIIIIIIIIINSYNNCLYGPNNNNSLTLTCQAYQ